VDDGSYQPSAQVKPIFTPNGDAERQTCEITVRVLSSGDLGRDVYLLQSGLQDMGYFLGGYGADGAFGSDTENALRTMQRDCNLTETGVAGKDEWQVIFQ
jgi:peptidoglycan hydrolase-like protein with peptidoglycan-binding domain